MNDINTFAWRWNDPTHLEAHRTEFIRPVEEILEAVRPHLAALRPSPADLTASEQPVMVHADWTLERPTGYSGLRNVPPDGSESFWAYRTGRAIPSHLVLGEREETSDICVWGWWEPDTFVIHTVYPGTVAPREIHDPALALADVPRAIAFWSTHAIITAEGAFRFEPY